MRLVPALFLLATLFGCTRSNGLYLPPDDGGGTADLAPRDLATMDLPKPFDLARPPDLLGRTCASTCAKCLNVACCGSGCCKPGEFCENGQCHCGSGTTCGLNEVCATPGPIGNNACGSICCGGAGNPCPL